MCFMGGSMRTVSVRDLRSKSAQIWRELPREKDMIVTSNGRPVGILSATSEADLEKTLSALRRARAMLGVLSSQIHSVKSGLNRLSPREINAEIGILRGSRPR